MSHTDDSSSAWSAASGSGPNAANMPGVPLPEDQSSRSSSASTHFLEPNRSGTSFTLTDDFAKGSSEAYACPECHAVFSSEEQRDCHFSSEHSGNGKTDSPANPLVCESCEVEFPTSSALKKHHVVTPECRPHRCTECPKSFTSAFQLSVHSRRVHLKERSNKCDHCDRTFFKVSDLRAHMNVHMGLKKICDICGKEFHHVSNLTRHRNAHLAIKPYVCKYCGKRFGQVNLLRYHKASHESSKPFACLYCDASFNSKTPLEKHVRANHAEEKQKMSSQVRQYYCCVCGENFGLCDEYKAHELQHEKLGELTCTECRRTFVELERFRIHSCDPDVDPNATPVDSKSDADVGHVEQPQNGTAMEIDSGNGVSLSSVSDQESLISAHNDAGKHLASSYDALVSQFVEGEDMNQDLNSQMLSQGPHGTTNMVIYVPTNPDGTPDVAAALEAVTGMPGGMGLPPGATLVQNGNEFVVTLNYDPSAIVSSSPATTSTVTSSVASDNQGYPQYSIPEQLQIPASMIMQAGSHSGVVTVQAPMMGETKMVDANDLGLHHSMGLTDHSGGHGGENMPVSSIKAEPQQQLMMQAGRDGTYNLVSVGGNHSQTMTTVDADGNPMSSSVLELGGDGGNLMSLPIIEGTGEDGQEVRYCVVLDPSSFSGDGSGQPTAITLPDGSYAYVNALPSTDGGAENGCVDGTSGAYTLQLYDDNRHVATVDSSGGLLGYPLDFQDPELAVNEDEIRAMMVEGDTLNDRLLTAEEEIRIDATIDRVVTDGKNNNATDSKEKTQNYECQYCGKKFGRKYTFKQHLGIHDQTLHMYRCDLCKKSFAYKTTLKKHNLAVHHNQDISALSASLNQSHDDSTVGGTEEEEEHTNAESHLQENNANDEHVMMTTSECLPVVGNGIPAAIEEKVLEESWQPRPAEVKNEIVEGTDLSAFSSLPDVSEAVTAPTTSVVSTGAKSPIAATGKPEVVRERNHKCDTCPKAFYKKHDLMVHQRSHTKDFPYGCPTCGVRFNHSSHVKRHAKSCPVLKQKRALEEQAAKNEAEAGSSLVPECLICQKVFSSLTALYEHMQGEHMITVEQPEIEQSTAEKLPVVQVPTTAQSFVVVRQPQPQPASSHLPSPASRPVPSLTPVALTSPPSRAPITISASLATTQVPPIPIVNGQSMVPILKEELVDPPRKTTSPAVAVQASQTAGSPIVIVNRIITNPTQVEPLKQPESPEPPPMPKIPVKPNIPFDLDMPTPLFVTRQKPVVKSVSAGVQSDLGEFSLKRALSVEPKSRASSAKRAKVASKVSVPSPNRPACCCKNSQSNGPRDCVPICCVPMGSSPSPGSINEPLSPPPAGRTRVTTTVVTAVS